MVNRAVPDDHSLRTRFAIFAFLILVALSYGMEKRMELAQQTIEIDYN